MNTRQDYYEIDLLKLFSIMLQRWWLIVLSALICASLSLGYAYFFIAPVYSTNVLLYVNNSLLSVGSTKVNLSTGDIAASQELVHTYGVILKANLTLQEIEENLNNNSKVNNKYTYKQLSKMISSSSANNTEIMKVTVECTDYDDAVTIANTVAEVLPKRIGRIVDGTSVTVVDLAEYPTEASYPSYTKFTMIGLVLGFVFACLAIFVYETFIHDVVDSEDWLRENFGTDVPVLAIIHEIGHSGRNEKYYKSKYYYKNNYKKYYSNSYYESNYYSKDTSNQGNDVTVDSEKED